mmetsp:Transcript_19365/g.59788  ORF Transcript_19365/g.59788 Transcript_19365/m.59788 type:complete len:285 (-) Transcript_19365:32-886(-)
MSRRRFASCAGQRRSRAYRTQATPSDVVCRIIDATVKASNTSSCASRRSASSSTPTPSVVTTTCASSTPSDKVRVGRPVRVSLARRQRSRRTLSKDEQYGRYRSGVRAASRATRPARVFARSMTSARRSGDSVDSGVATSATLRPSLSPHTSKLFSGEKSSRKAVGQSSGLQTVPLFVVVGESSECTTTTSSAARARTDGTKSGKSRSNTASTPDVASLVSALRMLALHHSRSHSRSPFTSSSKQSRNARRRPSRTSWSASSAPSRRVAGRASKLHWPSAAATT